MQRTLFVLLCDLLLVFGNPFTFTLPKTQTTSEKQLDQDIKDIFLSGSDITGRFGDNTAGGGEADCEARQAWLGLRLVMQPLNVTRLGRQQRK